MDIDGELQTTSSPPNPCESLWFSDGNVVIATDTLLFKVHKSVLSMRSSVFKDMFNFPSVDSCSDNDNAGKGATENGLELYEGLPMVTLIGDKGKDVAHLLRASYEPHYFRPDREQPSFEIVIALLTLSSKYDFKLIQKDVVSHIAKCYPMSLKEQDELKEKDVFGGFKQVECHFELLKAVFIADIDFLLPRLYHACSDNYVGDILRNARRVGLHQRCLETLLEGKERIDTAARTLIARIPDMAYREHRFNPCTTDHDYGGNCLEKIRFSAFGDLLHTSNMGKLAVDRIIEKCTTPLCESCREVVEEVAEKQRHIIWGCIPISFYLPTWDRLRVKMKEFLR
ncbi:hypothetical protein SCHPADRAFT_699772 [Schizopora paradoxa]|uniref:BTB domain-containing protein n=1 Tax=Schizopora paradoxa TaxID=27342 RepID=A0A0H2RMR1_9AGAM|nr:hypothetical protein SCHPADRAFT_699772 [Schizopora paradoxa]